MRILLTLIALLCFIDARACQVQLPERVIVSGADNSHCAFDQKNCIPEDLASLCELVQSQEGILSIHRLQAAVGERVTLRSTADQIRVQHLSGLVKSKFPLLENVEMELAGLNSVDFVPMSASSEVEVKCHPCLFAGNEVFRLQIRQFGSEARDYNFNAKFTALIQAFRAKATINAFSGSMNAELFEKVKIPQVSYARYQTDLAKINYYKPNKTIRAGEILRECDLTPLTLVRAGDKVDLFFENDHVRLKSHATSRQNGGMGDKIEVWNQANGKKYRGVITDHNRVVVEL